MLPWLWCEIDHNFDRQNNKIDDNGDYHDHCDNFDDYHGHWSWLSLTSIHEVEYEAEFVGGVEGVRHADDERTIWKMRKD